MARPARQRTLSRGMIVLSVAVEKQLGAFALAAQFHIAGGVTALFGPSGAGKTSLVNMIAGLLKPDRGSIMLDDTTLFDAANAIDVPPHRRRIGYVFQEGRLFPHMSVGQNLDYGRCMSRRARDPSEFERIESLLGITHLLQPPPPHAFLRQTQPRPLWPCLADAAPSFAPRRAARLARCRPQGRNPALS